MNHINTGRNENELNRVRAQHWTTIAASIVDYLDKEGIKFVLIKVKYGSMYSMNDVDILLEGHRFLKKTLLTLISMGYTPYRQRLSIHPWDLTFEKENDPIQVDIYPEAKWVLVQYCKPFLITKSSILRSLEGVTAYMPSYSLDLLITITHSFYHGCITPSDIEHMHWLLREKSIDWHEFSKSCRDEGFEDIAYGYLGLMQYACGCLNGVLPEKNIFHSFVGTMLRSVLISIYRDNKKLTIPLPIRLSCSFSRIIHRSSSNRRSVEELLYYLVVLLSRGSRKKISYWELLEHI